MLHYVNIAWGFIFWTYLFVCGRGQLFAFSYAGLFIDGMDPEDGPFLFSIEKKERAMCCKRADTKSMTKNKTEGEAAGRKRKLFLPCFIYWVSQFVIPNVSLQWMKQLQLPGQI